MDRYKSLADLCMSWNQKINLVSRKDIEHLTERHILHSLGIAIHAPITPSTRILDVGTGGGYPGLPLAIMFPDTRFMLIDSIGKKVNVVKSIAAELKLENVRCLQIRAEDYKDAADMVVSRAVSKLDRFTTWVAPNLRHKPSKGSGIWYLKGGDLEEEVKSFRGTKIFDLKDVFSEPFFETKKLVWLSPHALK